VREKKGKYSDLKSTNPPIIKAGDSGTGVDCNESFGEHPASEVTQSSTLANPSVTPAKFFNHRLRVAGNVNGSESSVS
jgi:hypothetical protein